MIVGISLTTRPQFEMHPWVNEAVDRVESKKRSQSGVDDEKAIEELRLAAEHPEAG